MKKRLVIGVWEVAPGIAVLRIKGTVAKWDIDSLTAAVDGLFARGIYRIAIDLGGTDLVASGVFGCFFTFADQASRNGGQVVFAAVPDIVRIVFERLGIIEMFHFAADVDSAVKELAAGSKK